MEKIVVNDTNVFIDLLDVGLLDKFFLLPWEIHTTDFVMLELLREGQKEAVEAYKVAYDLYKEEINGITLVQIGRKPNTHWLEDSGYTYMAWKD